jgi:hypothetical protein
MGPGFRRDDERSAGVAWNTPSGLESVKKTHQVARVGPGWRALPAPLDSGPETAFSLDHNPVRICH